MPYLRQSGYCYINTIDFEIIFFIFAVYVLTLIYMIHYPSRLIKQE